MHAWFRPRRPPGRLGAVGVSRLLAFQLIQVGLFIVLASGVWVAILGGTVGAVATVVTFGRSRGRWWAETAVLWLRYRRRREATAATPADGRLAALAQLVPDLVVEDVSGPDSTPLGMASDGAGWFAVLEVAPSEAGISPPVPLAALARIAVEAEASGVVMQVVTHSVPVEAAADRRRVLWVVVRLDADTVATDAVGDPDRLDVPAVLAELARRVRWALKRRGLAARMLDADGVLDALTLACDLVPASAPPAPGPPVARARESWDAWHSPRLAHRCFWLRIWPDPESGTVLLASITDLPGAQVSISLVLEPRPDAPVETDLSCLVRIATPQERSRQVCAQAGRVAQRLGGEMFPLDGEHATAVYASAPTGGGAR